MAKFSIGQKIAEFLGVDSSVPNMQPSPAITEIVTKQLKLLLRYVAVGHFGLFLFTFLLTRDLTGFIAFHGIVTVIFLVFSRYIDGRNFYVFYWLTYAEACVQASVLYASLGDSFSVEFYLALMVPVASYALLLPTRSYRRRNAFIVVAALFCMLGFMYFSLMPHFHPLELKLALPVFTFFKIYYIAALFGLSALETYFFTRRMVGTLLSIEETKSELSARANFDALTGLYNRYEINKFLAAAFSNYTDHNTPLSVCMGDIDNFKQINDTCGHNTGDYILKTVAQIMNNNIRKSSDFLGRWGGEEFLLVMPANQQVCFQRAEVLRQLIQNTTFEFGGRRIAVTITFGVAGASKDTPTPEALIELADKMLYKGKRGGKNRTIRDS